MRGPIVADGWLKVPYGGHDLSRVEIAIGETLPKDGAWLPAGLDAHRPDPARDEQVRVAMVRPPSPLPRGFVWLRVDGHVTKVGRPSGV